jgi:hypothetical protein
VASTLSRGSKTVEVQWHVAATQKSKEKEMSTEEPTQDHQDKAFGAAASRDQEVVDALEKEGVTADELPDEPAQHPRAGGKAEPTDAPGKN